MKRKIALIAIPVILVLLSAAGFVYYKQAKAATKATTTSSLQTATVRKGNLVLSVSGTGSVVAASEVKLAFEYSGKITQINVKAGDQVKTGDVLASLVSSESTATLQAELTSAEIAVLDAQKALDDLKASPDALAVAQAESDLATAQTKLDELLNPTALAIAQAQEAVITAQDTVTTAQNAYDSLYNDKGDAVNIATAKANVILARQKVDLWQNNYDNIYADPATDYRKASALSNLTAAQKEYEHAVAVLNWYIDPPSANEITAKQTDLDLAKAQLVIAQDALAALKNPTQSDVDLAKAQVASLQKNLDDLKAGATDLELKTAEAQLANAQAQLVTKQEAMKAQAIISPMDGMVLSVEAAVGDAVSTSPIITIANLKQPELQVLVDETDMGSVTVGYPINVTFDAYPNLTFTGKITSIDPSLNSFQNVSALIATAQLDSFTTPDYLPVGLSASVEIVSAQADNALLVPVEALRKLDTNKYGVFVMQNGSPVLKIVEVGIQDSTYAEIKSGLKEGDVVTTGIVETGK